MFSDMTMTSMPAENSVKAEDLHQQRDERDEPQQQDREAVSKRANTELEAGVLPPDPGTDDGFDEWCGLAALGCTRHRATKGLHQAKGFFAGGIAGIDSRHPLPSSTGRHDKRSCH
jgi:hypothetical protein